ncbi:MAG TPA: hypothetical protein G4O13_04490 [Dehalococcoidia bacterium]|nr:hypothetical protein [Dehalococcoidia bacterium]
MQQTAGRISAWFSSTLSGLRDTVRKYTGSPGGIAKSRGQGAQGVTRARPGRVVHKRAFAGRSQEAVELWGRRFTIVDRGLDPDEVYAAISDLNEMLDEAEMSYQAGVEGSEGGSDMAFDDAEEQARDILKEAEEKAEEVVRRAQERAAQILERSKHLAEKEVKNRLRKAYEEFMSEMKISEKTALGSYISMSGDKATEPSVEEDAQSQLALSESKAEAGEEVEPSAAEELEAGEPEEQPLLAEDREPVFYEGLIELAVRPPVGSDQVLQLHKTLRHMPEIEVLNLGISDDKGIRIGLFLESPLPLLEILSALPEVEKAAEVKLRPGYVIYDRRLGVATPDSKIIVTYTK